MNNALANQRVDKNGNISISLTGDFGDESREVYFWYTSLSWGGSKTYTASTTLAKLASGSVTLEFK